MRIALTFAALLQVVAGLGDCSYYCHNSYAACTSCMATRSSSDNKNKCKYYSYQYCTVFDEALALAAENVTDDANEDRRLADCTYKCHDTSSACSSCKRPQETCTSYSSQYCEVYDSSATTYYRRRYSSYYYSYYRRRYSYYYYSYYRRRYYEAKKPEGEEPQQLEEPRPDEEKPDEQQMMEKPEGGEPKSYYYSTYYYSTYYRRRGYYYSTYYRRRGYYYSTYYRRRGYYYSTYYRRRGYYYTYYRRRGYYYSTTTYYYSTYRRRYYNAEVEKPEEPEQPEQLAEDQATESTNFMMATYAVCGLLAGAVVAGAVVVKRRQGSARSEPLLEN